MGMMANPVDEYRRYLLAMEGSSSTSVVGSGAKLAGRNEVLLMVEQRIRLMREVEGTSLTALGKEEIITALQGILAECRAAEYIPLLYNEVDRWRRVKFVEEKTEAGPKGGGVSSDASSLGGAALQGPCTPPRVGGGQQTGPSVSPVEGATEEA